jgi:predicted phosphoadenosine phosphosulfate sulfurtransferase
MEDSELSLRKKQWAGWEPAMSKSWKRNPPIFLNQNKILSEQVKFTPVYVMETMQDTNLINRNISKALIICMEI